MLDHSWDRLLDSEESAEVELMLAVWYPLLQTANDPAPDGNPSPHRLHWTRTKGEGEGSRSLLTHTGKSELECGHRDLPAETRERLRDSCLLFVPGGAARLAKHVASVNWATCVSQRESTG